VGVKHTWQTVTELAERVNIKMNVKATTVWLYELFLNNISELLKLPSLV
jgi:hypothetical protein